MKKHIYPNGLTLVYEQSPQKICALYAYVKVGSINENERNRGSSHFIEHMCFKGTTRIKNSKDLFTSYDKIGAVFNAFTEKDHTVFFVQCGDEYLPYCLNIMSDSILNSKFDPHEYKMEIPIMLEEMIRSQDDPNTNMYKEIDKFIYAGSPYSEPIDDIEFHNKGRPYNYNETVDYYHKYYRPENIVISIVSGFSFAKIKQVLSKSFFLQKSKIQTQVPTETLYYRLNMSDDDKPEIKLLAKKGMKSHHLSIVFKTCEHSNADRYALNLLSQILGGGMGSRLTILLREHNGLTYESSCSTDYLRVGGEFMIYAVLDPSKLFVNGGKKGVLPLIVGLIRDLIVKGINAEELANAKGNYKGKLLLQQEKANNKAEYNGIQVAIYGDEKFTPYGEMYEKCYKDLTVENLNEVIRKYLKHGNMFVTVVGEHGSQFPTLEKMEKVCRIE
jgi:predicted Zn-dependent peptidase